MRLLKKIIIVISGFCAFNLGASVSNANPVIPISNTTIQPSFLPEPPTIQAKAYLLMDADSGKMIAQKNAETRLPPASLTKVMSLYLISSALKNGLIHPDDKVRISTKAWKAEGSRMFVKVNDEVPARDLIQGIVVDSGNDATIAMAEYISGTEDSFAKIMNTQAQQLGMNNSNFTDSTGLPNPNHYSTPHDFALLTQAFLKNFPEDFRLFSEKWFTYNNIKQPNRNRLLWRYPYATGLKTGHTKDAGYCLIGTATKDGMHLISVVMGTSSDQVRTEETIRLLNYGFRFYETHKVISAGQSVATTRVWKGAKKETTLGLSEDLFVTLPPNQFKQLETKISVDSPLKAPIEKGKTYGMVNLVVNNQSLMSLPLVALEENPQGAFWRNMTDNLSYGFHKVFSKTDETINNG